MAEIEQRHRDAAREWRETWFPTVRSPNSDRIESSIARLLAAAEERGRREERASKDHAYDERNRLVAWLASMFPSSLERHPDEDETWEDDWRWIVFIDGPTGQLSWHLHDSHLALFDHVPRFGGRTWDGHTSEEKYGRIAAALRSREGR